MLINNFKILQCAKKSDIIKLEQIHMNELMILLPLPEFTYKLDSPLFSFNGNSPAEITLIGITTNQYKVAISTPEFDLIVVVPSLVLEVINPEGIVIIKIIAPPE